MVFFLAAPAPMPCNIHPVYSLIAVRGKVKIAHVNGKYQASSSLSYRVQEVMGAVIVTVEPGVLEHVRGHQIIASRVAHSSNGHVEATGSSEQQARSRLADGIRKLTADQNKELLREERAYDNVTENGAAQSQGPSYGLPGGPDVQDAACTR